jgi:hypothetical protein
MERRKITARDILNDVKAGMSDPALMAKYNLSAQGLDGVFRKLVAGKHLTQRELDDRTPFSERTVDVGIYICPACGHMPGQEFSTCPRCGFSFPEHLKKGKGHEGEKRAPTGVVEAPRSTTGAPAAVEAPAGPLAPESVPAAGEASDVLRVVKYCRVLGLSAILSFVLVLAGVFMVVQATVPRESLFTTELMLGYAALVIATLIMILIVCFSLLALSHVLKVLERIASTILECRPPGTSRPQ